MKFIVISHASN